MSGYLSWIPNGNLPGKLHHQTIYTSNQMYSPMFYDTSVITVIFLGPTVWVCPIEENEAVSNIEPLIFLDNTQRNYSVLIHHFYILKFCTLPTKWYLGFWQAES